MEDERSIARALQIKLAEEGFEVKAVSDGQEGLEILKKELFDFIVLDVVMPKLDGFKVLQNLKEKNIKTSVIVLTNLGQAEDEKRAKELGALGFFIKANTPLATIIELIKKN